jgi:hypothetical protein
MSDLFCLTVVAFTSLLCGTIMLEPTILGRNGCLPIAWIKSMESCR